MHVSHPPWAGNHAEVVWKPLRGGGEAMGGLCGSHSLCKTWFPAPSPHLPRERAASCGTRSSLLHTCEFQIQICTVCPVSGAGHASFYTVVALKQRRWHGLKQLYEWDFYLLPSTPPFPPQSRAPADHQVCPHQRRDSEDSMVGSMYSPPKFQPSVPVTWRPASHFRSLPDPGSLVAKLTHALQGACSVLPPPPCSIPSQPRDLPLFVVMRWRRIYPYIYTNMCCNLRFLFL